MLTTSFRKTFFAWRFILNENIEFLIGKVLSGTICLFCFSVVVFFFQINTMKF